MPDDDDEFGLDLDDDEPTAKDNKDQIIQRLQKKAEKLEAAADKKFEEGKQAALKEIEVQTNVTQWATKVNNPKLGEVFLKTKPEEVTEEGFFTFAADLGFKPPEEGETPVATVGTSPSGSPAPAAATPDPFHRTGGAVAPNSKLWEPRELDEARRRGEISEAQMVEAIRAGHVKRPTPLGT